MGLPATLLPACSSAGRASSHCSPVSSPCSSEAMLASMAAASPVAASSAASLAAAAANGGLVGPHLHKTTYLGIMQQSLGSDIMHPSASHHCMTAESK